MPQVSNRAVEEMLKNADPQSRRLMAGILKGKFIAKIYCMSEECDGRHIGNVLDTGERDINQNPVTRVEPVTDTDGKMYLRSTRNRLDGFMGCECWCGNDSRIAAQESEHLSDNGAAPTRDGLFAIYESIQKSPTQSVIKDGRTIIDGFAFEGVE